MKKTYSLFSIFLLAALLASACGNSVEMQPPRFGEPIWRDGEVSTYAITDIEGEFAGTMTLELNAADADSESEAAWMMQREINSSTKEIVTVEVNERLRPVASSLLRVDSVGSEQVVTTYSSGQVDLELTNKQDMVTYERMSVPSNSYDQRTLLPFARLLPLADGYATQLNSYLPIIGRLERTTLRVRGQETVSVPAGSFDTWRITLETPTNETEAWIGTSAPFPLVKFIDGRNGGTFELQE